MYTYAESGGPPLDSLSMGEITVAESRILDAVDVPRMVASLVELVRVPSITGTAAESELQQRSAGVAAWGLDVDTWRLDLDALRADPRFPGTEAGGWRATGWSRPPAGNARTGAAGARGRRADRRPGQVGRLGPVLRRHPGPGRGFLHGRGACDMKAGVAANAAVVRTLAAQGLVLTRPLAVHTVVSEEDGGLGAFATSTRPHRRCLQS